MNKDWLPVFSNTFVPWFIFGAQVLKMDHFCNFLFLIFFSSKLLKLKLYYIYLYINTQSM